MVMYTYVRYVYLRSYAPNQWLEIFVYTVAVVDSWLPILFIVSPSRSTVTDG